MKRTLYTLAIFAVLSGCSDQAPETPPAEQAAAPVEAPTDTASDASEEKPEPTVLFDILGIANKSEADVEAALGKPTETETGNWTLLPSEEKTPYVLHFYEIESGKVEALFIEGKAARISFYPKDEFKYPDDAIKTMRAVGLAAGDRSAPDFEAPHYVRYEDVNDFFFVDVISGRPENPDRIREVKVVTGEKYK